jgi:hypothetical protein
MTPMTGSEGVNAAPEVVIPIVLFAMFVIVLAAVFRRALMGTVDELVHLLRTYGPVATRRTLDHRPGLAASPWFCDRCQSRNGLAAKRCYHCGATREEAEAPVPGDAEEPAGPSAGLTQRTRRRG